MKKISLLFLLFIAFDLHAQQNTDLQKLAPKRFRLIDKVEILGGPSINFPSAKDPSSKNPDFTIRYNSKIGYSAGIGLIHAIKNFELKIRVLWELRGYFEDFSIASTNYEFTTDAKNHYVTFSFIPTLYFGERHRFYVLLGGSYQKLNRSEFTQKNYSNGQLTQTYVSKSASGVSDDVFDAISGCGYVIYSENKKEISVALQDNYGLTFSENQYGRTVKNNTLQLNITLKITR